MTNILIIIAMILIVIIGFTSVFNDLRKNNEETIEEENETKDILKDIDKVSNKKGKL